jgi:hypothetical protein
VANEQSSQGRDLKNVEKPVYASFIMAIITFLANRAFTNSLSTLIMTIAIGSITYIVLILLMDGKYLREESKSWLALIGQGKRHK